MKLEYHEGKNFGDAINPLVFHNFLPDFFDADPSKIFIGIGSILGLKKPEVGQKAVVFSSGYAAGAESTYGTKPVLNDAYKIYCVRGPLTAEHLGISQDFAITDGAILLGAMKWKEVLKKRTFSFIPHVGSLDFFDWEAFCAEVDIHFIDPRNEPERVIEEIRSSEKIITEAMHGAIIADTFRIPWTAVKAYSTINEFKWRDWCLSMNLKYEPIFLPSIFNSEVSSSIISRKLPGPLKFLQTPINLIYQKFQSKFSKKKLLNKIMEIKSGEFGISNELVFQKKLLEMLDKIREVQKNDH